MAQKDKNWVNDVLDDARETALNLPGWMRKTQAIRGGPIVFGVGWLGAKIVNYLNAKAYTRREVDISDGQRIGEILDIQRPDVVINAAGVTGRPNIDWCEDHKEETFFGNVTAPLMLYYECRKRDIDFVHLSSGCIYDGPCRGRPNGFVETDPPNPVSYYGITKVTSEELLLTSSDAEPLILRIRMPVDDMPNGRNLITKLVGYKEIISVPNSVTGVEDFLYALKKLVEMRKTGIYHITNPGWLRHTDIMDLYKKFVDPDHQYSIITLGELDAKTRAKRSNCLLDSTKLMNEGIFLRLAPEMINTCMRRYAESIQGG